VPAAASLPRAAPRISIPLHTRPPAAPSAALALVAPYGYTSRTAPAGPEVIFTARGGMLTVVSFAFAIQQAVATPIPPAGVGWDSSHSRANQDVSVDLGSARAGRSPSVADSVPALRDLPSADSVSAFREPLPDDPSQSWHDL